jgi:two-component system cell cycle sensor histidine kinase/response regulator CckA
MKKMNKFTWHSTSGWLRCIIIITVLIFVPTLKVPAALADAVDSSFRTIRVVMDANYPPYIFKDSDGHLKGILLDQWRLWEQKTGIRVELNAMNWDEAQRRMQAGEFDVIDTIFRNEEREKIYDFSKPYARIDVPIFFSSDISGINGVNDLKGFVVGVKSGDNAIEVLRAHGITTLLEFKSYEAIVAAARDHKINVFTVDKPPAHYYLYKFGINDQFRETKPFYTGEFHRAVLKRNKALLETVESGFAKISKTEYKEIEKRWYGRPILINGLIRQLWLGSTVVVIVLSGLFLWLWLLRRLVAQRTAELQKEIETRIRQEELLRESELRFRTIFDASNEAIFIHELPSGNIVDVNQTMCKMYGYTRQEALHLNVDNLSSGIPPYTQSDALSWIWQAMAGEPQLFEWQAKDKAGRLFWVEVGMRHVTIGSDERIMVTARDIAERKQAEESLLKSEAKYRELIEGTSDLVTQVDAEGRFLYVNHNAETFFGCPAAACVGRSAFDFVHPDDRAKTKTAFKGWVRNGISSTTYENRSISLNGELHDLLWTINFHYAGNEILQVNSIARDISEQRKLQNEQLKSQKLESLGVLAGGIAHDFNNILTGIVGNISLASMFLDESHRASKILLQAEQASKRATDLAHQLLTFAKGSQPIKKLIAARKIVEASTSLVLSGSNVLSVIDIPDDLHDIEVDEGQINQAFNNIIINAAQAMPGGGSITIKANNLTLDDANAMSLYPGDYVRFTFTDTGCGISEEDLKRIFDPYFTTKVSGNGLGLTSAYSIISKHGGHISVRSKVGTGTTFDILLPASNQKAQEKEVQTTVLTRAEHTGCSILLMDDEEMIRYMAAEMLGEIGYNVQTCSNGEEAVVLYKAAMIADVPFAAVIMDLTIPGGMGGKEAAKQILDLDPAACLVVSSGYSNDPIMAEYSNFGFCATLVKPYTLAEIVQAMSKLLSGASKS